MSIIAHLLYLIPENTAGSAQRQGAQSPDERNLQRFIVEIIAEAGAVADVIGVGTEFLAEAGDVDIYGAIRNDGSCPDAIHELLAGAQLTMSRHQLTQQTILGTRKTDGRTVDRH